MQSLVLSAFAASMLLGLAGVAAAQQQNGQTQNMPPMDHSNMQGMQGMDHSKMPMNMPGNRQAGQGARTPAPAKPARPGTAVQ